MRPADHPVEARQPASGEVELLQSAFRKLKWAAEKPWRDHPTRGRIPHRVPGLSGPEAAALHRVLESAESLASALHAVERERDALKTALEPGKASAIVSAMFDLAEEYGHPAFSSRHALTFFREQLARLQAVEEALRPLAKALELNPRHTAWSECLEGRDIQAICDLATALASVERGTG